MRINLSKEEFIKLIETIQEEDKINREIEDILEKISSSYIILDTPKSRYLMLDLIFTKEEVDWIDWWLYEDVEKIITYSDGEERDITKIEELYNFLIEEQEDGLDE